MAAPRSVSQLSRVLHRLLQSRHPPHALTQKLLERNSENRVFSFSACPLSNSNRTFWLGPHTCGPIFPASRLGKDSLTENEMLFIHGLPSVFLDFSFVVLRVSTSTRIRPRKKPLESGSGRAASLPATFATS